MENLFLIAIVSTLLYLVVKFVEMKYLDQENKTVERSGERWIDCVYFDHCCELWFRLFQQFHQ
jgi:hypothetical protein